MAEALITSWGFVKSVIIFLRDDIKSSEKISILNQLKIGGGGGPGEGGPAGCQV